MTVLLKEMELFESAAEALADQTAEQFLDADGQPALPQGDSLLQLLTQHDVEFGTALYGGRRPGDHYLGRPFAAHLCRRFGKNSMQHAQRSVASPGSSLLAVPRPSACKGRLP